MGLRLSERLAEATVNAFNAKMTSFITDFTNEERTLRTIRSLTSEN